MTHYAVTDEHGRVVSTMCGLVDFKKNTTIVSDPSYFKALKYPCAACLVAVWNGRSGGTHESK